MKKNKYEEELKRVEKYFRDFFDLFYNENREVSSVTYRKMEDGEGFSAVIRWKDFTQYINYYCGAYSGQTINANFELNAYGYSFLVHFDDILDELDCDDLSFCTYVKCVNEERIKSALEKLLYATKNYYNGIADIASSQQKSKEVFNEVVCEENEIKDDIEPFDKPEDTYDFNYVLNGVISDSNELKRELEKKHKKNKLEGKFEHRAYRILSQQSVKQLKSESKSRKKAEEYPLKYRLIINVPYIVFAIIFFVLFFFIGAFVDESIYENCIGRDIVSSGFGIGVAGASVGVAFSYLLRYRITKLIAKKDYDNIKSIFDSESKLVVIICAVIMVGFMAYMVNDSLSGMAFKDDKIVYKSSVLSKMQEYTFDEVEIARITGYDNEINDDYAFLFDDTWVEYSSDDESKPLIEKMIKSSKKEVKSFEDIEDVE